MKLVCPHCAKVVEVPDSQAGQTTKCGFCQGPFTAPLLPPDLLPAAPPATPAAAPVDPPRTAPPASTATPAESKPQPRLEETMPYPEYGPRRSASGPGMPKLNAAAIKEKLSGVAQKLPGKVILRFDPSWLAWVAPVGLILLFIFAFFTWVGFDVGGSTLLSQSGFGVAFGSYSTPATLEVKLYTDSLILIYLLAVFAGFLASAGLFFLNFGPPNTVAKAGPWQDLLRKRRPLIFAASAGVALLCLLLHSLISFPMENIAGADADKLVTTGLKGAVVGEFKLKTGAAELMVSDFVRWRFWWRLTQWLSLIAGAAALADWLLDRRGLAGTPKLEVAWGLDQASAPASAPASAAAE